MTKQLFILSFLLFSVLLFSQDVNVEEFATGFDSPINIQHAGDNRLFIVEQGGIIKILNADSSTNATPFLNINSIVSSGGERGLLGLAFHPNYTTNGFFFINYINNSGNTVIARYSVSANSNVADSSSAQILMTIDQPYSNHNGGSIVFGADGYLYIGMGDGGGAGDSDNYSQNGNSLLGKMLRIEVGAAATYSIPTDNPFVSDATVLDEIWAIGVRNPWKFSFDKTNNDLWIADVGQDAFEEINHTVAGNSGLNYGWRCYEANAPYNTSGCDDASNYTFPVAEYALGGTPYKCAITGGYVYRGSLYPDFDGLYFFADYCSSEIGTVNPNNSNQVIFNNVSVSSNISTFGEDINGELYVAGIGNGTIYKIIDETLSVEDNVFIDDISVNPNPTKGAVFIKSESGNFEIENIQIFNTIGNKVLEVKINNVIAYQLDLNNLKQGIYFLKIQLNNLESVVKKLIIK
ncbi:MAG: PQQ-dependent sugar dehydrogenase [Flavobacteriaceae bacterium]|nr:PQQ-dependent sugar dehydrogenase [Flavobacteriaceae bacterium]